MISRVVPRRLLSPRWGAAVIVPLVLLAGCGDDKKTTATLAPVTRVTVASVASTPERQVISEIYAIGLERAGLRVARLDGVADPAAGYQTVLDGQADVVPDFTDELLTLVRSKASSTTAVPAPVAEQVSALTAELPQTLNVLAASPAEHKASVACTDAVIAEHSLINLSSLAVAPGVTIGIVADSAGPITAKALDDTYAVTFTTKDLANADAARPLVADKSVQCLALDSSNPLINELQLKVLVDDKAMVPGHAIIPLVNANLTPDVRAAIDGVSARLNTTNFGQLLNALASGTSPHVAARAFLDTTSDPAQAPQPSVETSVVDGSTPTSATGDASSTSQAPSSTEATSASSTTAP